MLSIVIALVPVFVLILVGIGLKQVKFPTEGFWPSLRALTYFLLLPALLIKELAVAELGAFDIGSLAAANLASVMAVAVAVLALKPLMGVAGGEFVSVFVGAIRFNAYVGIGAAAALYDDAGLTLASLVIAIQVPLIGLLSVMVLAVFAPRGENAQALGPFSVIVEVLRNPLVLACMVGIGINLWGLKIPAGIDEVLAALGAAALPMGLISVGAGLRAQAVHDRAVPLLSASVLKLAVMPAAMIVACTALDVSGLTAKISLLFAALPTAGAAYLLARETAGEAPLMAAITSSSTVAAAITMPALILGFG